MVLNRIFKPIEITGSLNCLFGKLFRNSSPFTSEFCKKFKPVALINFIYNYMSVNQLKKLTKVYISFLDK